MSDQDHHVTLDDLDDRMAGIEAMMEELKALIDHSAKPMKYVDVSYTRLGCGCTHVKDMVHGPFDLNCKPCAERIALEISNDHKYDSGLCWHCDGSEQESEEHRLGHPAKGSSE